jgi:hypothetical protein
MPVPLAKLNLKRNMDRGEKTKNLILTLKTLNRFDLLFGIAIVLHIGFWVGFYCA